VRRVPIPEGINVQASYPIGTLADATHPHEAARFLAYVRSAAGQDTLTRHGFLTGLGGLE
jgi:ABC-type molybdate transport system substrate-binding protein